MLFEYLINNFLTSYTVKKQWAIKNDIMIINIIENTSVFTISNVYISKIGTDMARVIAETRIFDKNNIKSPTVLIAKILNEFSRIIMNAFWADAQNDFPSIAIIVYAFEFIDLINFSKHQKQQIHALLQNIATELFEALILFKKKVCRNFNRKKNYQF